MIPYITIVRSAECHNHRWAVPDGTALRGKKCPGAHAGAQCQFLNSFSLLANIFQMHPLSFGCCMLWALAS